MQKVLVTGVNGLIGGAVYTHLLNATDRFDVFGLDRSKVPSARVSDASMLTMSNARFFNADLTDFDAVLDACKNRDVVIHLAANPDPGAPWEDLLQSNILGTRNVFEACHTAGVKRVVYASSGQAVIGYRLDEPYKAVVDGRFDDVPKAFRMVDHTMPTRPLNAYGSTKVWGEALARTYADVYGMSCLCIRFGWVVANDALPYPQGRDVWCSCRDAVQMVYRCVTADEALRFGIFHAFSKSDYLWADIDHAREVLGYVPQDDVAQFLA